VKYKKTKQKGKKMKENPKKTTEPQTAAEVLKELNLFTPWVETRGAKRKYFFDKLQPGQIIKQVVKSKKARAIHTAMLTSAKQQGFKITIQNKGTFLKIKMIK